MAIVGTVTKTRTDMLAIGDGHSMLTLRAFVYTCTPLRSPSTWSSAPSRPSSPSLSDNRGSWSSSGASLAFGSCSAISANDHLVKDSAACMQVRPDHTMQMVERRKEPGFPP